MAVITDHNWHNISEKDLPAWVKKRVGLLNSQYLRGNTFEYRREKGTGKYQKRLKRLKKVNDIPHDNFLYSPRDGRVIGEIRNGEYCYWDKP